MAIIAFLDGVAPFTGSRRGVTFDVSQAGPTAKKRASPVNRQTNLRMQVRAWLYETNAYFWNLPNAKKDLWLAWAIANGVPGPYGAHGYQGACAAFFKVQLPARYLGDPFYDDPPGPIPIPGVTYTNLVRIDKDTIRATFNPSPAGALQRIYLRGTLPRAGFTDTCADPTYCHFGSATNPTSPYDFPLRHQHLAGLHAIYYAGTQDTKGRKAIEDVWNL